MPVTERLACALNLQSAGVRNRVSHLFWFSLSLSLIRFFPFYLGKQLCVTVAHSCFPFLFLLLFYTQLLPLFLFIIILFFFSLTLSKIRFSLLIWESNSCFPFLFLLLFLLFLFFKTIVFLFFLLQCWFWKYLSAKVVFPFFIFLFLLFLFLLFFKTRVSMIVYAYHD